MYISGGVTDDNNIQLEGNAGYQVPNVAESIYFVVPCHFSGINLALQKT